MGGKPSKILSMEVAQQHLTAAEWKQMQSACDALSTDGATVDRVRCFSSILDVFLPGEAAELFYRAMNGGAKAIAISDLICGLTIMARGNADLKKRLVFEGLDSEGREQLSRKDVERLRMLGDGETAIKDYFARNITMDYAQFSAWALPQKGLTVLDWIHQPGLRDARHIAVPTITETFAAETTFSEVEVTSIDGQYNFLRDRSPCYCLTVPHLADSLCPPLTPALGLAVALFLDHNNDRSIDRREFLLQLGRLARGDDASRTLAIFDMFYKGLTWVKPGSASNTTAAATPSTSVAAAAPSTSEPVAPQVVVLDGELNGESSADEPAPNRLTTAHMDLVLALLAGLGSRPRADVAVTAKNTPDDPEDEDTSPAPNAQPGCACETASLSLAAAAADAAALPHPSAADVTAKFGRDGALTADQFVAWAGATNALRPLFAALRQALVLYMGLIPTPAEELEVVMQRHQFDGDMGSLTQAGAPCYVLAAAWWDEWRLGAGPAPASAGKIRTVGKRAGPIANQSLQEKTNDLVTRATNLLSGGSSQFGTAKLKRTLQWNNGCLVVSDVVWNALYRWYGGGPTFQRTLVLIDGVVQPELHPLSLKVLRLVPARAEPTDKPEKPQTQPLPNITISRYATTRELLATLRSRGARRTGPMRLWNHTDPGQSKTIVVDSSITLEQCDPPLTDGSTVLIEMKNADNTWPSELYAVSRAKHTTDGVVTTLPSTGSQSVTGLSNLGNTCYLNCALQCLRSTVLTTYFKDCHYVDEVNERNPLGLKGRMARAYAATLQQMLSGRVSIAPVEVLGIMQKQNAFVAHSQHDAHEALSYVLDMLHEDLNRIVVKPYVERKDSDGRPDAIVAQEAWEGHLRRNSSIIVDLLTGLLRSQLRCLACGFSSVAFDPFTALTLPLPSESTSHTDVVLRWLAPRPPTRFSIACSTTTPVTFGLMRKRLAELAGLCPCSIAFIEMSNAGGLPRVSQGDQKVSQSHGFYLTAWETNPRCHAYRTVGGAAPAQPCCSCAEAKPAAAVLPADRADRAGKDAAPKAADPAAGVAPAVAPAAAAVDCAYVAPPDAAGTPTGGAAADSVPPSPSRPQGVAWRTASSTAFPDHVIALHRRFQVKDTHIPVCPVQPATFGQALLVPLRAAATGRELYEWVWALGRGVLSPEFKRAEGAKPPFELCAVDSFRLVCLRCPWNRFCSGCPIPFNDEPVDPTLKLGHLAPSLTSHICLAVDWDTRVLHLHGRSLYENIEDHSSVAEVRTRQSQPVTLEDCFRAFTKEEELTEGDLWYCPKCKSHQKAAKKLDIWAFPPVLVVHLKRFHNSNGHWVKSSCRVQSPINGLHLVGRSAAADSVSADAAQPVSAASNEDKPAPRSDPEAGAAGTADPASGAVSAAAPAAASAAAAAVPAASASAPAVAVAAAAAAADPSAGATGAPPAGPSLRDSDKGLEVEKDWFGEKPAPVDLLHKAAYKNDTPSADYDLVSVACHSGSLGGGHYVAYVRDTADKWIHCNDSHCKQVSTDRVPVETAYLLFYQARNLDLSRILPPVSPQARAHALQQQADARKGDNPLGCSVM
eukprot:m.235000 g.235000  ORF g.235000 m.235000 type:complete len:1565 (-) comp12750_c0_seq1:2703-7397(-)